MPYTPEELPRGAQVPFDDKNVTDDAKWEVLYEHACTFKPADFEKVMMNLIRNPNINTSWLFRADILLDTADETVESTEDTPKPRDHQIADVAHERTMIRRLIPRNTTRDAILDQTCTIHKQETEDGTQKTLVIYLPHVENVKEVPFYHPKVKGVAHYHEYTPSTGNGKISMSFLPFQQSDLDDKKLRRVAYHLLEVLNKHGHGAEQGYVKRVNHDVIVSQQRFQNRYQTLKDKYARALCKSWAESTDPTKHVFEDLGIASFLIELWTDMYRDKPFPGFVDIGCGNGLLVNLLIQEGFTGWGFDARERKSWAQFNTESTVSPTGKALEQRLLLPSVVPRTEEDDGSLTANNIHDGLFPSGTFIISNHADELTPWTPILAALSDCPFIMIPCCSHKLTGEKFRPPPPRDKSKSQSSYSSLVDWASQIAEKCGWKLETEMLRIPSTRNIGLLGRTRLSTPSEDAIREVIQKYGGVDGYYQNVKKLVGAAPRTH